MTDASGPAPARVWTEVGIGVVLRKRSSEGGEAPTGWEALVTRRPETTVYAGYWEFPGGKLDPGESPELGVRREIEEETGLLVDAVCPLAGVGPIEHVYAHGAVRLHIRLCRPKPGSPEARPIEVADARWIALEDLPALEFPEANEQIISALLGGAWIPDFEGD